MPGNLKPGDFFLGGKVLVYSRLMTIVDFGDPYTRRKLGPASDTATVVLSPDSYRNLGEILAELTSTGMTVTKLQSFLLKESELAELFPIIGADGPYEQLVKFWTSGTSFVCELRGVSALSAAAEVVAGIRARYATNDVEAALWCAGASLGDFFFGSTRKFEPTATLEACSCGVIRPHAVKSGDFAAIISAILGAGFTITALQMLQLNKTSASEFLEVYDGVMPNFPEMVSQLCTGPAIALEVKRGEGKGSVGVVEAFRDFVGPWDVEMAKELRPMTVRAKYGRNRTENAIHCTDLPEDGEAESAYFFQVLQQ
jgi:nucleoside-diphosphate kinase